MPGISTDTEAEEQARRGALVWFDREQVAAVECAREQVGAAVECRRPRSPHKPGRPAST